MPLAFGLVSYGYIGTFVTGIILNLVPFTNPSNLILAGLVAGLFPQFHPLGVGMAVAAGATTAKIIHYTTCALAGKAIDKSGKLNKYGKKIGNWGFVATFLAAATPLPDDWAVIPLGVAKYSFTKFMASFLLGKLVICCFGAYLGLNVRQGMEQTFGEIGVVIIFRKKRTSNKQIYHNTFYKPKSF